MLRNLARRILKAQVFLPNVVILGVLGGCAGNGAVLSSTSATSTSAPSTASSTSASTAPTSTSTSHGNGSSGGSSGSGSSGSGSSGNQTASLVFSYPDGFAAAGDAIQTVSGSANITGSVIDLTNGTAGEHEAGAAWYTTKMNIGSFTTDFTFRITPTGYGITFCIQNDPRGLQADADANGIGYFQFSNNPPGTAIENSIGIVFNASPNGPADTVEATPSLTGLYIDGGELIDGGIQPVLDLTPQGINLSSGDLMDAHITYDGAILTMVLTDTNTGTEARFSWPVDIPAIVGGTTAYVGFGAGTLPAVAQTLNSWSWWSGINTRLASPTFSVAAGSYTATQTVSLSGPAGASIHYTTNGKPPTAASTLYSGPITVSSSQYVQAIAIESGYTDSLVAGANYSIGAAGTPLLSFPNGFANASDLFATAGTAIINGSAIQLTDSTPVSEVGAAWYVAPVNIQSFTASFTLKFTNAPGYGMAFVIQNQNASSTDTSSLEVSGGPYNLGVPIGGLGYQDTLASVAVKFDTSTSPGNTTGLDVNGESPYSSAETAITGVDLSSGDPIGVTLTYDGATLSLHMEDTATGGTFSTSWAVNIPQEVGGDTAYIGFTGATNFNQDTIQDITAMTFGK